jgi:hypothetical protein
VSDAARHAVPPQFGLDADRVGAPRSLFGALRRRVGGRYVCDPFGLDVQLSDLLAPVFNAVVRVDVEGAQHVPSAGGATFVMNSGYGLIEPTALAVAVFRTTGRRLRVVGAHGVSALAGWSRRFGAIAASPEDIAAALHAGHLVAVPTADPPLELVQAMMGYAVHPVAVRAGGPLGTAIAPWKVRVAAAIPLDGSYPVGDPLGAAELAEEVRATIAALHRGERPPDADRTTAGLVAG